MLKTSSKISSQHKVEARDAYRQYLIGERIKALKQTMPGVVESKLKEAAEKNVNTSLQQALQYWFSVARKQPDEWLNGKQVPAEPEASEADEV